MRVARVTNRPPTWKGWTTTEVRTLFIYWRTGRPVHEWARKALPQRTKGTIRVYAHRFGLPRISDVRKGRCLYSVWPPASV